MLFREVGEVLYPLPVVLEDGHRLRLREPVAPVKRAVPPAAAVREGVLRHHPQNTLGHRLVPLLDNRSSTVVVLWSGRPPSHGDVPQLVKKYAVTLGLDPPSYSGHSLRAEFVTSAVAHRARLDKTMEVTRQCRTQRYILWAYDQLERGKVRGFATQTPAI